MIFDAEQYRRAHERLVAIQGDRLPPWDEENVRLAAEATPSMFWLDAMRES